MLQKACIELVGATHYVANILKGMPLPGVATSWMIQKWTHLGFVLMTNPVLLQVSSQSHRNLKGYIQIALHSEFGMQSYCDK